MIIFPIVLILGQAEVGRPLSAFWPFGSGETTPFSARFFVLSEPPQSLAAVDFGAGPDATAEIANLRWPDGQDPFWEGGPTDNFAAQFTATIVIEEAGDYSFHLASDDGSALLLDGARIIDNDGMHPMMEQSVTVALEAGRHEVEVLYMELGGSQGLTLDWSGPDTDAARVPLGARDAVAAEASAQAVAAAPAAAPGAAPDTSWMEALPGLAAAEDCGFAARYFVLPELWWGLGGVDFTAEPEAVATVPSLAWPLGGGPFWEGGPVDGFAAHFATTLEVGTAGAYSFHLVSDDGSVLLVGGMLAINNDGAHPAIEQMATLELAAGTHRLDVAYFERDGDQQLTLDWSGPDTSGARQPLSPVTADCQSRDAASR